MVVLLLLGIPKTKTVEVEEVMRADGPVDTTELTKELGDVLFDVLMMIEVTKREHPEVNLEACSASAVKKLERRAPYIFPGNAPAGSVADANKAWEAGKRAERETVAAAACSDVPESPPSKLQHADPTTATTAAPPEPTAAVARSLGLAELDDEGNDDGLSEWDRDFKRDAGPPSITSEDDDDN